MTPNTLYDVYLGLGSNLGNRLEALKTAARLISEKIGQLAEVSEVYETEALLKPDSPASHALNYLNCVLLIRTGSSPHSVFDKIEAIEKEMGRERNLQTSAWAPREIDIDILLFGSEVIDKTDLKIPHSEILNRKFILTNLLEINSKLTCPLSGKSYQSALAEAPEVGMELTNYKPEILSAV